MADELRMVDILEGIIEEEAQIKLANVQEAYKEDPQRMQLLGEALDFLKEASDKEEIPALDPSQALSMAVELVEEEMIKKEAEAWAEIGETCAGLLNELGVGPEEISKIASEEEADALGRLAARAYATHTTGEDYLGDLVEEVEEDE
jgi:hypothetical protein